MLVVDHIHIAVVVENHVDNTGVVVVGSSADSKVAVEVVVVVENPVGNRMVVVVVVQMVST